MHFTLIVMFYLDLHFTNINPLCFFKSFSNKNCVIITTSESIEMIVIFLNPDTISWGVWNKSRLSTFSWKHVNLVASSTSYFVNLQYLFFISNVRQLCIQLFQIMLILPFLWNEMFIDYFLFSWSDRNCFHFCTQCRRIMLLLYHYQQLFYSLITFYWHLTVCITYDIYSLRGYRFLYYFRKRILCYFCPNVCISYGSFWTSLILSKLTTPSSFGILSAVAIFFHTIHQCHHQVLLRP